MSSWAQRVFRRLVRKLARIVMYSPWAIQTVVHNGWPRKCVFYGAGAATICSVRPLPGGYEKATGQWGSHQAPG